MSMLYIPCVDMSVICMPGVYARDSHARCFYDSGVHIPEVYHRGWRARMLLTPLSLWQSVGPRWRDRPEAYRQGLRLQLHDVRRRSSGAERRPQHLRQLHEQAADSAHAGHHARVGAAVPHHCVHLSIRDLAPAFRYSVEQLLVGCVHVAFLPTWADFGIMCLGVMAVFYASGSRHVFRLRFGGKRGPVK